MRFLMIMNYIAYNISLFHKTTNVLVEEDIPDSDTKEQKQVSTVSLWAQFDFRDYKGDVHTDCCEIGELCKTTLSLADGSVEFSEITTPSALADNISDVIDAYISSIQSNEQAYMEANAYLLKSKRFDYGYPMTEIEV